MLSFLGKQWRPRGEFSAEQSLFANFCKARGKSATDFAPAAFSDLAEPFSFREMERTTERIFTALKNQERILLFGDYDVDGVSGVAQLFLTLQHLRANVSYRLPARSDGYGLAEKFVEDAAKSGATLLITVDCGISNAAGVALAKAHGIDVIITDHHALPGDLPEAYAILHPLEPQETFHDKDLTGSGVSFFLCLALLRAHYPKGNFQNFAEQLLELAVLGTVADCGALFGQNRIITLLGLAAIKKTKHPGLKALLKISAVDPENITAESIGFYLAPRLNAAGRMEHPDLALELLCRNFERASEAAEYLQILNRQRQELVEKCFQAVEVLLSNSPQKTPAIILADPKWSPGILGLLSARLTEKYSRPAIICSMTSEKISASCRGPEDFHFAENLREIAAAEPELFLSFGGHAAAAGFSILPENFARFQELFTAQVIAKRGLTPAPPVLNYDGAISIPLSAEAVAELKNCEPFGTGNPAPQFLFSDLALQSVRTVGENEQHLSLFFRSPGGQNFGAIWFQRGNLLEKFPQNAVVDLIATPEVNEWQGRREVRLKVLDARASSKF